MRHQIIIEFKRVDAPATIEVDGVGQVTVEVGEFEVENDGIGAYECHGFRGYDFGSDYVVVYSLRVVEVNGECYDPIKHYNIQRGLQKQLEANEIDAQVLEVPGSRWSEEGGAE